MFIICVVFLKLDEKYSIVWLHWILEKDQTKCEPSDLGSIHPLEQGLWGYHRVRKHLCKLQNKHQERNTGSVIRCQLLKLGLSLQDLSVKIFVHQTWRWTRNNLTKTCNASWVVCFFKAFLPWWSWLFQWTPISSTTKMDSGLLFQYNHNVNNNCILCCRWKYSRNSEW